MNSNTCKNCAKATINDIDVVYKSVFQMLKARSYLVCSITNKYAEPTRSCEFFEKINDPLHNETAPRF
jgi:hypothetical protein